METIGWDLVNPVTGPVYMRGAGPGHALCVEVIEIEITRAWVVWETDEEATGVLHDRTEEDAVYEVCICGCLCVCTDAPPPFARVFVRPLRPLYLLSLSSLSSIRFACFFMRPASPWSRWKSFSGSVQTSLYYTPPLIV